MEFRFQGTFSKISRFYQNCEMTETHKNSPSGWTEPRVVRMNSRMPRSSGMGLLFSQETV